MYKIAQFTNFILFVTHKMYYNGKIKYLLKFP